MFSGRAVTLALWSGSLFSGRAAQSFSAAEPLTPAFSAAEPFNIYERASIFVQTRAHETRQLFQYAQRARLGLYKRRARRHSLRTDTSRNALNCSETYARPESSRLEEIILHSGRVFAKVVCFSHGIRVSSSAPSSRNEMHTAISIDLPLPPTPLCTYSIMYQIYKYIFFYI